MPGSSSITARSWLMQSMINTVKYTKLWIRQHLTRGWMKTKEDSISNRSILIIKINSLSKNKKDKKLSIELHKELEICKEEQKINIRNILCTQASKFNILQIFTRKDMRICAQSATFYLWETNFCFSQIANTFTTPLVGPLKLIEAFLFAQYADI